MLDSNRFSMQIKHQLIFDYFLYSTICLSAGSDPIQNDKNKNIIIQFCTRERNLEKKN